MRQLRFLFVFALAVCGVCASAEETVRLQLWQGFKFSEVSMLRENIREFEEQWNRANAQKVRIEIATVPFANMVQKIKSAALARQIPDMAFVDANSMVQLAYGGVALPLDELANFPAESMAELRERYVPGAFDTNVITFKGETHLYGLPAQTSTLALFWNRKMFAEKADELRVQGLDPERAPRDWEEFIRYGKILTDARRGIYAFGMNNSLWFTMPFFNQYGAELAVRDESGKWVSAIDSPNAAAALARKAGFYLEHRIEGGAWREGSMDPDQGFLNSRYAMILTGPWMIEEFRSSGLDFGVALIPRVPLDEAKRLGLVADDISSDSPEAEKLSAGNIGGQNLVISTACRHPEIALQFALHFAGERVQRRWAEELGQIPVALAAHEALDLSRFPEVPVFMKQVTLARPLPALPFGSVLEIEIVNPEMNLVLQERQTPRQALSRAARSIAERILKPVNEAEAAWRDN